MDRKSNVSRTTSETDIQIEMNLDGKGKYNISTGVNAGGIFKTFND